MNDLPVDLLKLSADTVRTLTIDAIEKSNSGHPGMPMGAADLAVVLWSRFLKHAPADPNWPDRDRFVLSVGHGSMLLYSLLHLSGYDLSLDDLKKFRQWGSRTPGHPEFGHTDGVEMTTGPLGQGISSAVGMAIAERTLAARFNRPGFEVVDHHTYVIAGDGDLMEGVAHESGALAGHLNLGKLIVLYDDNSITIDGSTALAMSENVAARYAAYGWHTVAVDGHDYHAVAEALTEARAETKRPTLILCRTQIGFGSPNRQGTSKIHGSPLGAEEAALTKHSLGRADQEPFYVPDEAAKFMRDSAESHAQTHVDWSQMFNAYEELHPQLAAQFIDQSLGLLPENWGVNLPRFTPGERLATRAASGKVLAAIVPHLPSLVGGSADLTGSNKTYAEGMEYISPDDFIGRYIHYGVREHGMGAIMNGLSLHGGIRPYGGTFLVFSDYMRGSIRLAALMNQPIIYVFTHDSIGLGEDGPTHQPIEHLMSLRVIPNLFVFRPGDANETAIGWQVALERKSGPTVLALTRHKLPTLDAPTDNARLGGYLLKDSKNPQAIIIATGSEVEIGLAAQEQLAQQGIPTRLVSMPCWRLFEEQSAEYRASVLPPHLTARVAIEAGSRLGWERYVGQFGRIIGLDHFGASAPFESLYENFGITAEAVSRAVVEMLT